MTNVSPQLTSNIVMVMICTIGRVMRGRIDDEAFKTAAANDVMAATGRDHACRRSCTKSCVCDDARRTGRFSRILENQLREYSVHGFSPVLLDTVVF
jgi:hypothetical protein